MRLLLIFLLATFGVHSSQKHEVGEKGNSNAHPSKPISSAPSPSQASANPANANPSDGANQNKNQSVSIVSVPEKIPIEPTRDRFDVIVLICTAILTIVGIVGTCAAIKTLKTINRQAEYMLVHARHLDKIAKAASCNAKAASDNAAAIRAHVDMLISKERMRINIEVSHPELILPIPAKGHTFPAHLIEYTISFVGLTVAFIEDAQAQAVITDSIDPPIGKIFGHIALPKMITPGMDVYHGQEPIGRLTQFQIDSINNKKSFLHFRAAISYKDFTETETRETCICYTWFPRYPDPMVISWDEWRESGPPEANRET